MSTLSLDAKDRYQSPIVKSGKEQSVRQFFTVANKIAPLHASVIESVYRYMRILDDEVDESSHIKPVISLLKGEREALIEGSYSPLQQELVAGDLSRLGSHRRRAVEKRMGDVMLGMGIDAGVRLNQEPLSESQVTRRNILDLWSVVSCFGVA